MAEDERLVEPSRLIAIPWWLFNQGLGWFGVGLIGYSLVAMITETKWQPVEQYAPLYSSLVTLAGVIVTATAVYIPRTVYHKPWKTNQLVVAPLVILFCSGAILFLIYYGSLPPVMVNGLAMLGLSGALQRLVPVDPRVLWS
jgi:hypothetical protein